LFTWTVIASMFVANCMLLVLNLPFVGVWARLCLVPYKYLAPVILAVCLVGAYSTRNSMFDVWVAMISGIIAYLLRKRQWPIGPLILAFLLGPMAEQSLRQSLALSDGSLLIFVERPYAGVLLLATLFVVVLGRLLRYKGTA
jgi:putative tricarboxylic transport membrane protein